VNREQAKTAILATLRTSSFPLSESDLVVALDEAGARVVREACIALEGAARIRRPKDGGYKWEIVA